MHEDESIDKTQWLPDDVPIINKYRIEKPDIKTEYRENGQIHYAQVQIQNVLNFLFDERIIEAEHLQAGYDYQAWRDYFLAQWSGNRSHAFWYKISDLQRETGLTSGMFSYLLRHLPLNDKNVIDYAVDVFISDHHRWLCRQRRSSFIGTFQKLVIIMNHAKDEINAAQL